MTFDRGSDASLAWNGPDARPAAHLGFPPDGLRCPGLLASPVVRKAGLRASPAADLGRRGLKQHRRCPRHRPVAPPMPSTSAGCVTDTAGIGRGLCRCRRRQPGRAESLGVASPAFSRTARPHRTAVSVPESPRRRGHSSARLRAWKCLVCWCTPRSSKPVGLMATWGWWVRFPCTSAIFLDRPSQRVRHRFCRPQLFAISRVCHSPFDHQALTC